MTGNKVFKYIQKLFMSLPCRLLSLVYYCVVNGASLVESDMIAVKSFDKCLIYSVITISKVSSFTNLIFDYSYILL